MGSKTLFMAVFIRPEQVVHRLLCMNLAFQMDEIHKDIVSFIRPFVGEKTVPTSKNKFDQCRQ